jgi:hypothetical protein
MATRQVAPAAIRREAVAGGELEDVPACRRQQARGTRKIIAEPRVSGKADSPPRPGLWAEMFTTLSVNRRTRDASVGTFPLLSSQGRRRQEPRRVQNSLTII